MTDCGGWSPGEGAKLVHLVTIALTYADGPEL